MRLRAALGLWAALASAAWSETIEPADYAQLRAELDGRVGFETLPQRPEPGMSLDQKLRFPGLWIGEHFAGMKVIASASGHDMFVSMPRPGRLALRPGARGRNLAVATHRGFGSNALFPLGNKGFGDIAGRGEGAVAVLFDHDQSAVGVRVHSDYATPLGGTAETGALVVLFLDRKGGVIAQRSARLDPQITEFGWRRAGGLPDIAGLVIFNTDPGGIALDDLIFARIPPLG